MVKRYNELAENALRECRGTTLGLQKSMSRKRVASKNIRYLELFTN